MRSYLQARLKALYAHLEGDALNELRARVQRLESQVTRMEERSGLARTQAIYQPSHDLETASEGRGFMRYSTCSAADLLHPRCREVASLYTGRHNFHRKEWETVYIINSALEHGLGAGQRALGFGVGREVIPSVFARLGAAVVATDAPPEIGIAAGWTTNNEFTMAPTDLHFGHIVDLPTFQRLVAFRRCDMNAIDADLTGFDFCWSACCLEHLGSLQHGIDFIINSVEKTLRIGGIACHTTELNLTSNTETVEQGGTVIYRKRDLDELVATLRDRGHEVDDIVIAPDVHHLDGYVDVPPYTASPHLKLMIEKYICTSVGLIIKRGR